MGTPALSSNWKLLQHMLAQDNKSNRKPTSNDSHDIAAKSNTYKRKSTNSADFEQREPKRRRPAPSVHTKDFSASQRHMNLKHRQTSNMGAQISTPAPAAGTGDTKSPLASPSTANGDTPTSLHLGKYIAIDTEMVGTTSPTAFSVANSSTRDSSIVARVSLVAYDLMPLYDAYVLPPPDTRVSDYRTPWSGITAWHLTPGNTVTRPKTIEVVQKEVAALVEGRVLVGHALQGDLKVLGLSHPRAMCRDTSRHGKYRMLVAAPVSVGRRQGGEGRSSPGPGEALQVKVKARTPSLKRLAHEVLGWDIQGDAKAGHSSVEDARATMALFRHDKVEFEREAAKRFGKSAVGGVRKLEAPESSARKHEVEVEDDGESNVLDSDEEDDEDALEDGQNGAVDGSSRNELKKKKKKKKGKYSRR